MKVFAYNTGPLLNEKCMAIHEECTRWRCVYVNFSMTQYTRSLRSYIIDTIIATLTGMDGSIYLCEDGDIVILFEGTLKPVSRKLGIHFEDFNLALTSPSEDNPFRILDFSQAKDWLSFLQLCSAKRMLLAENSMISAAVADGVR